MQSMTGFARRERAIGSNQISIEIKSVNHRYLDLRFRLPMPWQNLESALAEQVRAKIQRGSVDVSIRQKLTGQPTTTEGGTRFFVDEKAAASLLEACRLLHQKFQTPAVPSLEFLAATGKVFLATDDGGETATLGPELRALFNEALETLVQERAREGEQTRKALAQTLELLQTTATQWEALADAQPGRIRERLQKRIDQWQLDGTVDAQRIEAEVAFYAERSDISEELQRFAAHVEEFSKLLGAKHPVGRKLDFLTQELHREANTIASKADDLGISRLAVEAKTAIEKLREQVQNVE